MYFAYFHYGPFSTTCLNIALKNMLDDYAWFIYSRQQGEPVNTSITHIVCTLYEPDLPEAKSGAIVEIKCEAYLTH